MNNIQNSRKSGDPKSEARKPRSHAEALGQVFTPSDLARTMVNGLKISQDRRGIALLDPCVGPATFPIALFEAGLRNVDVTSYDIDPAMVQCTKDWATNINNSLNVEHADYLEVENVSSYDFAILNPPYLRQEWIGKKRIYQKSFAGKYGVKIPGTSNLYVYFLVKAILDLKPGGRLACIVYDSWQSTLYGRWLQDFLRGSCNDVSVEPVPNLPFAGRLIDATIVYCTRSAGAGDGFKFIENKKFCEALQGLKPIDDIFETKRGLRLKQADFFMSDISLSHLDGGTPFVKKVNLIEGYNVSSSHAETALLLRKAEINEQVERELNKRLNLVANASEENVSILTWYRERPNDWKYHAAPPVAPLLFNYYIRNRPKHIHNPNRAYSDNFYGSIPRSDRVPALAWLAALNSTLSSIGVMDEARNQGAGLAKLQLFEYRAAKVVDLNNWDSRDVELMGELGNKLVMYPRSDEVIKNIDELVHSVLANEALKPQFLTEVLDNVCVRAKKPK